MDANGDQTIAGSGRQPESVVELDRLKRKYARIREENEIIKIAARHFAIKAK